MRKTEYRRFVIFKMRNGNADSNVKVQVFLFRLVKKFYNQIGDITHGPLTVRQ